MNKSIDGIYWEADADTLIFSRVEGNVDEILGYSAEDWIDSPDFWQSKLHPEDAHWVIEACLDACRKRLPHRLTYRMLTADGRAVWLQDNVTVQTNGKSATLSGIMIDVTELVEQRRELVALSEQNAHYRALYDLVPVAIWEEDWTGVMEVLRALKAQGVRDVFEYTRQTPGFVDTALASLKVLSVNRAAVDMFRASDAEELLRRAQEVFLADEPHSVFQTALNAILRGERLLEGKNRLRRLNGEELHVMFRIALPDITEREPRVVICEMDVSAEHAANERFELVTRATSDVIWDFDIVKDTLWASEGLKRTFGLDPAEMYHSLQNWTARIHAEDLDQVMRQFEQILHAGSNDWVQEYRFQRGDGSYATVRDVGYILRDGAGDAVRMVGSLADITVQRKLEEQLMQAQKLEAVGQLTGGVAHDFNNLLTVILGNAEALSEALGDQHQLRSLADMTATAAERGAELTNRLLAFSRKQPLQPQVLNVSSQIHGMESLLRRTLPESIDIEIVAAAGLWNAEIDPSQLESALLNLALNARDAMPDGGHLTIEMTNAVLDDDYVAGEQDLVTGQYVVIVVTDTGEGMAANVLGRVFEPFFTTKEVGKGSGLGLSMVFGFVKQSGGHIRVYSEPGEGSSVKLYFPRAQGQDARRRSDGAGGMITGGSETILVVEDDAMVCEQLVARLIALGYKVVAAENGPAAVEMIARMPDLDLLFTDIVLPGGMNGRVLADRARALRPGLKVLFTSGYTENAIVHHGRLDRGVELLSKPYRRDQLAAKLRKVLDKA